MPNLVAQESLTIDGGGRSEKVSLSTTSAQSSAFRSDHVLGYFDCACYVRVGSDPTALGTGVDQYLPSGAHYRFPWVHGNKMAIIALTGTGNAYLTPGG